MAQRDSTREHPGPLAPRDAIERADEFGEEIVGIEFLDDRLHECARPRKASVVCGELPQLTWTDLTPPSIRIEVLFGPETCLQVLVDVGDAGPNLAHGSSSHG